MKKRNFQSPKATMLSAKQVLKSLPKTDCGECGEPDCASFAALVAGGEKRLQDCVSITRKQFQRLAHERRKILKALESENHIFADAEAYSKTNGYGEILSIVSWTESIDSDGKGIENHVALTTDGLVLLNQPVFKLKKPFFTLDTKGYPPEKVIDYGNSETYSGLIPFELPVESLLRSSVFRTKPFFFKIKALEEKSKIDNPWIRSMTGVQGKLLILFDQGKLETSMFDTETPEKMRVLEIPFWRGSTFSIQGFNNLLDDVARRLDKEENLSDPQIVEILRRRYCKKTMLEEELKNLGKQISSYPAVSLQKQKIRKNGSGSIQAREQKHIKSEPNREIGKKMKEETRKSTPQQVVWDTSHYETLRLEIKITELLKLIKKTTGLNVTLLKGSWKQKLLANTRLFAKTKILVMTGIGSQGKLSKKEVEVVSTFIKQGGSLLLSSPQFPGEDTNLLAKVFDASFKWNKLKDPAHHEGKYEDHVLISNFQTHPLSKGVEAVCFGDYGGFPIEISGNKANPIAFSDEHSVPSKALVLTEAKYGEGKVVLFSSSTTFKDKYLNMYDNRKLAENIFTYLSKPATAPSRKESVEEEPLEETAPTTEKEPIPTVTETIQKIVPKPSRFKKEQPEKRLQTKPIQPAAKPQQETEISPQPRKEEEKPERTLSLSPDEIEQRIDALDEKLALSEIDETTYDLERFKLKGDIEGLNQLVKSGSINLEKYVETTKNIASSSNAGGRQKCASCQTLLFGIESFCPYCGEKLK